jgi:hypothetical protein
VPQPPPPQPNRPPRRTASKPVFFLTSSAPAFSQAGIVRLKQGEKLAEVRLLLSSRVFKHLSHTLVIDVFGELEVETYRVKLRNDSKASATSRESNFFSLNMSSGCFANPLMILNTDLNI